MQLIEQGNCSYYVYEKFFDRFEINLEGYVNNNYITSWQSLDGKTISGKHITMTSTPQSKEGFCQVQTSDSAHIFYFDNLTDDGTNYNIDAYESSTYANTIIGYLNPTPTQIYTINGCKYWHREWIYPKTLFLHWDWFKIT
jgi:hypothetical protein